MAPWHTLLLLLFLTVKVTLAGQCQGIFQLNFCANVGLGRILETYNNSV